MIHYREVNNRQHRGRILIILIAACLGLQFSYPSRWGGLSAPTVLWRVMQEYDIVRLQQGYREGTYTIREVVKMYLERIEAIDKKGPALHSVIQVNPDALSIAERLDGEMSEGNVRGPLHGIPVLLKDNIDTHDRMATTAGSRALINSYPLRDSHVAKRLREAGAVILGKANLSEWANFRGVPSSSGWSGVGQQTKNPYVLDRNPCGSSSGSAVAVAANLTVLAIGTETNGSIVCPSGANGIVGIKPTVGLISRAGVIPISHTQDTPGPMARSVRDAAICLGVLTGVDQADEKTLMSRGKLHEDYTRFLKQDGIRGKRIGILGASLGQNHKVDALFQRAVAFLKDRGATVVEVDNLLTDRANSCSLEVMLFEYKAGLNAYFRSLGDDAPIKSVKELIAFNRLDTPALRHYDQRYLEMAQKKGGLNTAAYRRALACMQRDSREGGIDSVMDSHRLDAIIAPTNGPAWKTDPINGDHFQVGSSSSAALAGYPNITVPMGYVEALPVGISFFGRAWSEPLLLEIA